MLIQFNFENFRSFSEKTTLDMSATKISEHAGRVIKKGKEKLLPVAVIYGANASGKSNFYVALKYMHYYIEYSFSFEDGEFAKPYPFLFDTSKREQCSLFEVHFVDAEGILYNYGFCVSKDAVEEEWLNLKSKTAKEYTPVFYRKSEKECDLSGIPKKYRENIEVSLGKHALIVSLGAKLKVPKLKVVFDWFKSNEFADFGNPMESLFLYRSVPKKFGEDSMMQKDMVRFFNSFDGGHIKGFEIEKVNNEDSGYNIFTKHSVVGSDETANLPLALESSGTQKMFVLYHMLQKTMEKGSVFFIDELNARLHPLLMRVFILEFLNPEKNKNNAQLVFTTHDTWLLANGMFRRDEIWFTEKDDMGVSQLYSLADFVDEHGAKIRKDENYEKNYLLGKYGAIPELRGLDILNSGEEP